MDGLKWEHEIASNTNRLKVMGGWIIVHYMVNENDEGYMISICESMCFISDPDHKWTI